MQVGVADTDADEDPEEQQGQQLFAHDKAHAQFRGLQEAQVAANAAVDAQRGKDEQRPRSRGGDMEHRIDVYADADGLGQVGEFLEGVAQKNERQYLKLLAHGAGKGTRDGENKADDLHDEDERKGQLDGIEMVGGRKLCPGLGKPALAVHFDAENAGKVDEERKKGQALLRRGALPELVKPVKGVCQRLHTVDKVWHVCLRKCFPRPAGAQRQHSHAPPKVKTCLWRGLHKLAL